MRLGDDPAYDKAFRTVIATYLAAPVEICARCGMTLIVHAARAFVGDSDGHLFTELCRN